MKEVKIEFLGNSTMLRLYFVGPDFIDRVEEAGDNDLNNFDWLDFLKKNTLAEQLICRGFDADKPMKIKVYDDLDVIFEGSPWCGADEEELLDPEFLETIDDDAVFACSSDYKDIDEELLSAYGIPVGPTSQSKVKYGYCIIERFESLGSTGKCYLPVSYGFRASDLRLITINMDPNHTENDSLGYCLYRISDVELELDSVKYLNDNYPIDLIDYRSGESQWFFLKNRLGFWGDDEQLAAKVNKFNEE